MTMKFNCVVLIPQIGSCIPIEARITQNREEQGSGERDMCRVRERQTDRGTEIETGRERARVWRGGGGRGIEKKECFVDDVFFPRSHQPN